MVEIYLRLPMSAARAPDIVRALSQVMVSAQIDQHCARAQISRDAEDPSTVTYMEDWNDGEHLDRRIRSERFTTLLGLMEACPAPPTLEVRFLSEVRGLDYVAAVRGTQ